MYEVQLRRNVIKTLDRLNEPYRTRIIKALIELEYNARPKGIEKIRGTDFWRIRKGDYRLVYYIDDVRKKIIVVRVGHRSDIYKGL